MRHHYFMTISAGRTGTAWLARFLSKNLSIPSVHEPLGIDDFGTNMPDIKIMRSFNERGNGEFVQNFHRRKLDNISQMMAYAETNHTLCKCGLVENLAKHKIAPQTLLVILTRNVFDQCLSYLLRRDFNNVTVAWQWYLDFQYPNSIVKSKPFEHFGTMAQAVWYAHEMAARQHYYKKIYGDQIAMMQVSLEDITTQDGADTFLRWLGKAAPAQLIGKQNMNENSFEPELAALLADRLSSFSYSIEEATEDYLRMGRRLDKI